MDFQLVEITTVPQITIASYIVPIRFYESKIGCVSYATISATMHCTAMSHNLSCLQASV